MSSNWGWVNRISARLDQLEADQGDPDLLPRLAREYRNSPVAFSSEILGRTLYSKQREVADSVLRYPVTVVPAGRACGKSFVISCICLWWLFTRPGSRVIVTSADYRQVALILFSEIRKAVANAKVELPIEHISRGMGSPQRLTVNGLERWEMLGWAARTTEAFSGQHAGELLCVCDEASGIPNEIWAGIDGLAATRLLVSGNALAYASRFRELADLGESDDPKFNTVRISSLDSPDADREESLVGLAAKPFISYLKSVHGESSQYYRSNVLGEFPGQETVKFLNPKWLDRCVADDTLTDELWQDCAEGGVYMGIDPGGGAGGGDPSAIAIRNDKQLLFLWQDAETGILDDAHHRLEDVVCELKERFQIPAQHILYDAGGIGRSFGSYMESYGVYGTVAYYGSGRGGKWFTNRRSANAHRFRRHLDPKRSDYVPFHCGGIPLWDELRHELSLIHEGPMSIGEEGEVRQSLEPKEALMNRLGGKSPNLSDALLITYTYRVD